MLALLFLKSFDSFAILTLEISGNQSRTATDFKKYYCLDNERGWRNRARFGCPMNWLCYTLA